MAYVATRRGSVNGRLYHVNMPKGHFYGDQIEIQTECLGVFVPDNNIYQGVRIPHYVLPVRRNRTQMMLVCNKPCTFYPPPRFTQRIPNELREVARQASKQGLILQDWLTPEDWALVRPAPSLKRLQSYSASKLYPLEDMRQRSDSWTMNKEIDKPLSNFGKPQEFETGSLQELRDHNYGGNPPDATASDADSRMSLWSESHNSPIPEGTVNEERFEARNGRPGFWHEISLPVDRMQVGESTKTIENMVRVFPAQTTIVRFEPPTKEVWIPWQEQYEPFDFRIEGGTLVNQYYTMIPIPEYDQIGDATNTAVYPGRLSGNRIYRFFPRPLEYNGHQQRIPENLKQWARRDNCRRCVPLRNGVIKEGFIPRIRQPHTTKYMAELKTNKCKVQPSLLKQMVKARQQTEIRKQFVDTLSTERGRMPLRAITPVVRRPAAAPPQWESPIEVKPGTSSGAGPSPTSRTQWYVPLPPDEDIPVDENNYWGPFREDYEAASQMSAWDTNQRAIELAEMEGSASGTHPPATPGLQRSPSTTSTNASASSSSPKTLRQRWKDLKGTVTRSMHTLSSCCRRRGCFTNGMGCKCGHRGQQEEGEDVSMSTFHVPLDSEAFKRNLRPCCKTLECSREGGCACTPACF